MAVQREDSAAITRTYRASVRIGEDFLTLEETVSLPLDASDEDIAQAVALGWRIYQAQHESLEAQVAQMREARLAAAPAASPPTVREPDAPASERQRGYIARLQNDLAWSDDQLAHYASEHGIRLVDLTRGQASSFIDGLKRLSEEQATYHAAGSTAEDSEPAPLTERQHQALSRLAQERGIDLDTAVAEQYGVGVHELSGQQASELIRSWQRAPRS
jgi:hypothetical protein